MHTRILRTSTIFALALLLALPGCAFGGAQVTKPANPPTPPPGKRALLPSVHEVAQTTTLNGGNTGPATATCPQGEFALGGGWSVPVQGARVIAAKASGATWAVSVLPLGHLATTTVTVYVECLRDAIGAVVTQNTSTTNLGPYPHQGVGMAGCGSDEVRVGWGFDVSASDTLEFAGITLMPTPGYPFWFVAVVNHDIVSHPISTSAECLSNVTAFPRLPGGGGTSVAVTETYPTSLAPLNPGDTTRVAGVSCPAGQVVAGGGFYYEQYPVWPGYGNPYLLRATSTGWQVGVYAVTGLYALRLHVAAVCLNFSSGTNSGG